MKNIKTINVISLLMLISVFTSCNQSSKNSNESVFAEALFFGAMAQIKVEGDWNDDLMKQIKEPEHIQ